MKTQKKWMPYANLQQIVDSQHTVLVVWDVQNALVNRIFNKAEFVQNLKLFIGAARRTNIPIIYTKIASVPRDYDSSARIYMLMKRLGVDDPEKLPPYMEPGSPESEIYREVSPRDSDVILDGKFTASIFYGTIFEYMLRNRGINTILFTGIATEFGIDSSARDAYNRGFYSIIVEDCVSSLDKEMHVAALKSITKMCIVIASKDIIKQWK